MLEQGRNFDLISPTAHTVGILRKPYRNDSSQELVSQRAGSIDVYRRMGGEGNEREFELLMAARYTLACEAASNPTLSSVLELAAGLTPRGIHLTRLNPNLQVLETDLPDQIALKKRIIDSLKGNPAYINNRNNHPLDRIDLEALDATDVEGFERVTQTLPQGKVGVITEGLVPYLYREDLEKLTENVRSLLRSRGGFWFTDLATKKGMRDPVMQEEGSVRLLRKLYETSGTSEDALAFEDSKEARDFFVEKGLKVRSLSGEHLHLHHRIATNRGLSPERAQEILRLKLCLVLEAA